jgi:VWFA-related protein
LALALPSIAADQPVATFKGQSNLVLIPTVVHDKSGRHIPSLTKDDFTLSVDGNKHPFVIFEEIRPGNIRLQRPKEGPAEFSNMMSGQARPSRLVVIALDAVMTPELRQQKARGQLLEVLAKAIQSDSVVGMVLITNSGSLLVHDFTSDPQVLIQALDKVVGSEPIARETRTTTEEVPLWDWCDSCGETAGAKNSEQVLQRYYRGVFERKSQELERRIAIERELDALEQIGNGLHGIPGRKSLIWVGGGFPLTVSDAAVGLITPSTDWGKKSANYPVIPVDSTEAFRAILPEYERVWRVLNDANVAVYGVDVRGLTTEGDAASVRFSSPNEQARQRYLNWDTQDTFRVFADVTGGRAYTNMNDLQQAYRESMDDQAAYYLLGYYVDRKKDKPGWHDLGVKVDKQGADVRARRGFVLHDKEDEKTREQELDVALRSPLDYTGLPVMGQWKDISGKGTKRKANFTVLLPPGIGLIDTSADNHIDLEFHVRAVAPDGTVAAHAGQEMEGHLTADVVAKVKQEGIRYEHELELAPGEYTVHFVVRDRLSGRIGSATSTLKVGEPTDAVAK